MIYDLPFKASSETMLTIAADPKHLGARIGVTSVLHRCRPHLSVAIRIDTSASGSYFRMPEL